MKLTKEDLSDVPVLALAARRRLIHRCGHRFSEKTLQDFAASTIICRVQVTPYDGFEEYAEINGQETAR